NPTRRTRPAPGCRPRIEASTPRRQSVMAKVVLGNHSSVLVPRQGRDVIRLGDDFYIAFLYGDVPDESEFLRTARSVSLELKTDDVEAMTRRILDSGVRKLALPDPHLYFQAPGGQCLRLVGIDEDLSFYEGVGAGTDMVKIKQALGQLQA